MNILDMILLAVFAVCVFNGMRKGFVRTAASLFSVLISMALIYLLNPYVCEFLKSETPVYSYIEETCSSHITESHVGEATENLTAIDSLPVPESVRNILKEGYTEGGELMEHTLSEYLVLAVSDLLLAGVSFLLTFIGVSIAVSLLFHLLEGIFSIPGLSLLNRVAGGAAGALLALLVVWVMLLAQLLLWDTEVGRSMSVLIEESSITKWFYDSNMVLGLIAKFLQ